MRIYLAGPISGKGYDETVRMFESKLEPLCRAGIEVLHPMLGKEHLRNEKEFKAHGYTFHPVSENHAIFERDKWMVKTVDIVLADLSSADGVSIGTMFELAWASMLGRHTVVVLPDDKDNCHEHVFVLEAADVVFRDVDQAVKYLVGLVGDR